MSCKPFKPLALARRAGRVCAVTALLAASSAQALVDDLGRFLDGREVRARALNPLQRLARHR